jgi:4-amino-4-deoxy-L-arabinose transferase-like glycosyltransferase
MILLYAGRVLVYPAAGGDDAEQLLFSQVFAWGYDIRNPALYTWLVIAVNAIFGPTIAGVELLKFFLLWLTYVLLFHAARRTISDERYAALAALSPLAIYYFAWDAAMGYSHSVLLLAVCAATYAIFLRLDRRGDLLSYGLLGMVFAAGVLAKYGYVLFAAAMIIAGLLDAGLRKRLINWRFIITLALALALLSPHLLWMYDWLQSHPGGLDARLAEKFNVPGAHSHLELAAMGVWDAAQAFIGFLMPMLILFLVFFPHAFLKVAPGETASARHRRMLGWFIVLLLAFIAIMIIATGAARLRTHYMFVFILVPLYLFARAEAAKIPARAPARYALSLVLLAAVTVVAMPAKAIYDLFNCRKCTLQVPYDDFAAELRKNGFPGGTIVGFYYPYDLAGNFRVQFPDSRVISIKHAGFIPPGQGEPEPCLLIWPPGHHNNIDQFAARALGAKPTGHEPIRTLEARLPGGKERTIRLEYMVLGKAIGCR